MNELPGPFCTLSCLLFLLSTLSLFSVMSVRYHLNLIYLCLSFFACTRGFVETLSTETLSDRSRPDPDREASARIHNGPPT
jgi:hypothetical protein